MPTLSISDSSLTPIQIPSRFFEMDFHQLLIDRRSIRRYTADPISAEDVKILIEAALLSPSSKSSRAWQLMAVEDKETLLRLAECKPAGAVPLKNCPLAIVVAEDTTACDAWIEDGSVAATSILYQAAALGLGACWVQLRGRFSHDGTPSEQFVQEVLGIPEQIVPLCIITVGHKDEDRKPQNVDALKWENVHVDRW